MTNKTLDYKGAIFYHKGLEIMSALPIKGTLEAPDMIEALVNIAEGRTNYGHLYSAVVTDPQPVEGQPSKARYLSQKAVTDENQRKLKAEREDMHPGLLFDISLDKRTHEVVSVIEVLKDANWEPVYVRRPHGWVSLETLARIG